MKKSKFVFAGSKEPIRSFENTGAIPEAPFSPLPAYSRAETRGIVIGLRQAVKWHNDEIEEIGRQVKFANKPDGVKYCEIETRFHIYASHKIQELACKIEQPSEPPSEQNAAVRIESNETK